MKKEYDFSKGQQGKFFRPGVELKVPVYLDQDIADAVRQQARKARVSVEKLVNARLREEIQSQAEAGKS
jgi:hypothetical protein